MTASLGVQAFIFDIGWGELVLIGIVALIVFGPKELPVVLRTIGQYTTKIRRMAAEFQSQFQEAMREAEMAELKQHFDTIQDAAKDIGSFNPASTVKDQIEGAVADKPADAAAAQSAASAPADQASATEPPAPVPPAPAAAPSPTPAAEPSQPRSAPVEAADAGALPGEPEAGKGRPA